jgi:hypothetical protein
MALKGLDKVMANLNREITKIEGRTIAGLLEGGLIIEAEAKKRVPVEHGQLRASGFTRKAQNNPRAVHIGFSAAYAVFVHENTEMVLKGKPRPSGKGVYWGPAGESRFLANAATAKRREVLEAVARRAKVK